VSTLSPNFGFLQTHDPLLVRLAGFAELYATSDPNAAILRLRQFAEDLLRRTAAGLGVEPGMGANQFELLRELENGRLIPSQVADLFHHLRKAGNDAAHAYGGTTGDAVHLLKVARELAIWFHRTFGRQTGFRPGPFVAPVPSADPRAELEAQIAALRSEVEAERRRAEEAGRAAEVEAEQRRLAENAAKSAASELESALSLAAETEQLLLEAQAQASIELQAVQSEAAAQPAQAIQATVEQGEKAATRIELDEADTRKIIDARLRAAGWEADSESLRHGSGAGPQKGVNRAIAEWPTANGKADYVLFSGLTPVAVVEAKRNAKNVLGSIEQAKRYSRGYSLGPDEQPPGGPWLGGSEGDFRIPFLFATNGRPYLKQLEDQSGIWFHDARRPTNHPRVLEDWYTPEGLTALLLQDVAAAEQELQASSPDYLPLRDYQKAAISAVEGSLVEGRREMLVAMATGTGKTRTLLCLAYRFMKAKRFRRVLFLVDRSALGEQAADVFKDVRLESQQAFTDIYDVKELGDIRPDADTRLQIATVQGMVRRLLFPAEGDWVPPVDAYDCIVVDECHRGYTLVRELSDAELGFRSEQDYISKYRRVLEHFDAVKIGLTATPALHTTEIFGPPVYTYSYRQAVIDGWLVDHEPPLMIRTELSERGIRWRAGEQVKVYLPKQNQVELFKTPDEIAFEIEDFNRKVITEGFNRAVCERLAEEIDPRLPGKTLVFCATDEHADMVVRLLKQAFDARYGGVDDDAVQKITGAADQPLQLIRRYKNERLPSVAVTVDLLTTGIDVPEIANIVFLRRVRSRILYEQMLGRATRLCSGYHGLEWEKESFRIFDAVGLYEALKDHTEMTAVVPNPTISFARLTSELQLAQSEEARREVLDQIIAKLRRKRTKLERHAADQVQAAAGTTPAGLLQKLRAMSPAQAAGFFAEREGLIEFLDRVYGGERPIPIAEHQDRVTEVVIGYWNGTKPKDYLDSFKAYIQSHLNEIPALMVVTQRPRDLTRQQLKELALALDTAGYSEASLRAAYRDLTSQDIAATIVGFIRQQALGDPLRPYPDRVKDAVQRILASRAWTPPQRQWLKRIGKQLEKEVVVDREALDREQFRAQGGGFKGLDKTFDGRLEQILGDIQDALWQESA
jgi:type I restriction enzyme R subunit